MRTDARREIRGQDIGGTAVLDIGLSEPGLPFQGIVAADVPEGVGTLHTYKESRCPDLIDVEQEVTPERSAVSSEPLTDG